MAEKELEKKSGSCITIDGNETLEEYLDKKDWVDKSVLSDVEDECRETKRIIYKGKGLRYEYKDRSGRTRYLTDREIRKDYGLEKKPFDTLAENVIWTIFNKQPINVQGIAKEISWDKPTTSSLSAQLKGIWDRLGVAAKIIDRYQEKGELGFTYIVRDGVNMSVEAAIQKYKSTPDPRSKKSKKNNITTKNNHTKEILEIPEEPPISQVVSETISRKLGQLGMKVKITGHVEVVFRFIVGRD